MKNYREILQENFHHFEALCDIMREKTWPLGGGSYLINGKDLSYDSTTFAKQELLFKAAQHIAGCRALEVGIYSCHSILIMLIANPELTVHGIDPGFSFTQPCVDYLNSHFDQRITYHAGLSHEVLPTLEGEFDLFSLDGCHSLEYAKQDFIMAERLLRPGALVVWDDFVDGFHHRIDDLYDRLNLIEIPECRNTNALLIYK